MLAVLAVLAKCMVQMLKYPTVHTKNHCVYTTYGNIRLWFKPNIRQGLPLYGLYALTTTLS